LRIPLATIKKAVQSFKAVEGRLQYVRTVRGIQIYNDNNSTTPEATIAALKAFPEGKTVLIMGGADKGLDMKPLLKILPKYAKSALMLPGTGTKSLPGGLYTLLSFKVKDIPDALKKAMLIAEKGDVVLFSPAFASFGQYVNEYDRNDRFLKEVKRIK
jgi:UDP-N-acetylmuramoylalanine--D-glutamate ligase